MAPTRNRALRLEDLYDPSFKIEDFSNFTKEVAMMARNVFVERIKGLTNKIKGFQKQKIDGIRTYLSQIVVTRFNLVNKERIMLVERECYVKQLDDIYYLCYSLENNAISGECYSFITYSINDTSGKDSSQSQRSSDLSQGNRVLDDLSQADDDDEESMIEEGNMDTVYTYLNSQFQDLSKKYNDLNDKYNALAAENGTLKADVIHLKAENESLKQKFNRLESRLNNNPVAPTRDTGNANNVSKNNIGNGNKRKSDSLEGSSQNKRLTRSNSSNGQTGFSSVTSQFNNKSNGHFMSNMSSNRLNGIESTSSQFLGSKWVCSQMSNSNVGNQSTRGYPQDNNDGFRIAGKKKVKKIFGKQADSQLKSAPRIFNFYIGRCGLDTNASILEDHLKKFVKKGNIVIDELVARNISYKSYKVSVDSENYKEIMNVENWPTGVLVRRFFTPRQKNPNEETNVNQAGLGNTLTNPNIMMTASSVDSNRAELRSSGASSNLNSS